MNTDSSLQASFWLNIVLTTMGAVDMPGKGPRKMPSPRAYLATLVAWTVLQLGADAGYDRAASVVGWVIVLAGTVVGPFGRRIVNVFNAAATANAAPGSSAAFAAAAGQGATPLSPTPPSGTTLTP